MFFDNDPDGRKERAEKQKARDLRHTQWWKRQLAKGLCHYCHRSFSALELTMDHIIPISKGGKSIKGNVVCACKECNSLKKNLLPMEWQAHLDRSSEDFDKEKKH